MLHVHVEHAVGPHRSRSITSCRWPIPRAIGLGDEPFYEELARPLDQRQIIPMIQEPELREQARAVYELWAKKPDKIQF